MTLRDRVSRIDISRLFRGDIIGVHGNFGYMEVPLSCQVGEGNACCKKGYEKSKNLKSRRGYQNLKIRV